MPRVFLFCIAEEAKTFVRKVLDVKFEGIRVFCLVESRDGIRDGQKFKMELGDNESFETDFIGASEQDCREWALEHQFQDKLSSQDILAIADQRSASDETLSVQFYNQDPGCDFGEYGILPPEHDKWYEFRVIYTEAPIVFIALLFVTPDVTYPLYFGCKDKLTDERGIFNAGKAYELNASNIGAKGLI